MAMKSRKRWRRFMLLAGCWVRESKMRWRGGAVWQVFDVDKTLQCLSVALAADVEPASTHSARCGFSDWASYFTLDLWLVAAASQHYRDRGWQRSLTSQCRPMFVCYDADPWATFSRHSWRFVSCRLSQNFLMRDANAKRCVHRVLKNKPICFFFASSLVSIDRF